MSLKLRPLEEPSLVDRGFEGRHVDEHILIAAFTITTRARGPRPTEHQSRVALYQSLGQCSFAHPSWADQYCDQGFSGQEPERVLPVALDQDL